MNWILTLVVGAITSVAGGALAGFVANQATDWYSVPSREGAAGYFVLGFILLGLIVGFGIGVVTTRVVAARPDPGILKALGLSLMTLVSVVILGGGTARLLADVGPTIDGKNLILNVEFRWPEGAELPADTSQWFLRLSSASGRTVRTSEVGPLWREDARKEDGRWIVPGAVNLFTSRGTRLISVEPAGVIATGYEAPVPAWPGRSKFDWSDWLPRPRAGAPPLPGGVTYRWRLVPEDQPIRMQRFGDFEISTIATWLGDAQYGSAPRTWTGYATFAVRYRGKPVEIEGKSDTRDSTVTYQRMQSVALLPGADTALLVQVGGQRGWGDVWLVSPAGDTIATQAIAEGFNWNTASLLTNDPARFRQSAVRDPGEGKVELTGYSTPGLYLFPGAVFDSRTRSVRKFSAEGVYNIIDRLPPVAVSPDERSFVRVGNRPDTSEAWQLEVFDLASGKRYQLPVDRYRMRFGRVDDLDPAVVARFFEWSRGADGRDHLIPRAHPVPLPYRGVMSFDDPDYREYRVYLATESLRGAMIDWLAQEFQGERLPADSGAHSLQVKVKGQTVYLSWDPSDEHVGLWVDRGSDTSLVTRIAERWNAALATGRYDRYFADKPPSPGEAS
ncbi:MAG TPA: hypothetical protein VLD58_04880 [Gemmatimonadales bacterium]|nr:hypothetical protein [Gemmatimonadales bacterium]